MNEEDLVVEEQPVEEQPVVETPEPPQIDTEAIGRQWAEQNGYAPRQAAQTPSTPADRPLSPREVANKRAQELGIDEYHPQFTDILIEENVKAATSAMAAQFKPIIDEMNSERISRELSDGLETKEAKEFAATIARQVGGSQLSPEQRELLKLAAIGAETQAKAKNPTYSMPRVEPSRSATPAISIPADFVAETKELYATLGMGSPTTDQIKEAYLAKSKTR